ncbi:MAG: bifunctional precorrin-2 dehydrogenase/sirohydrochlorin ferrochelatase [Magnetococcales bacterium]|nr:bifunctional precorrin-2 dehydrogenase/sirohydrochlorin ferrochelatase [Magnetococcales bacterium]
MTTPTDAEFIPALPLFLDLRGRPCLVLGGEGAEGARKTQALLTAGARVTLLAHRPDPALQQAAAAGRLRWLQEEFRPDHLEGMRFVLSTLEDEAVNRRMFAAAEERGIFVNVVDQRRFCSAIWPAVVSRPPVIAALSTGGTSPALAAHLRRRLAALLPEAMGDLARWLGTWRRPVAERIPVLAERSRFWYALMEDGLVERFLEGGARAAEGILQRHLRDRDAGPGAD